MTKITNKVQLVVIGILFIALVVSLLRNGCEHKQLEKANKQLLSYKLEKQTFDSVVNAKNQVVLQQDVIITTDQEAINDLAKENFNLKKKDEKNINTIALLEERVKVKAKGIRVPYLDSALVDQISDSIRAECKEVIDYYDQNSISVPRKAQYRSDSINLDMTLNRYYATVDSVSLPDSQYIRFVEKKTGGFLGLFRKKTLGVQVLHTNPLWKVDKLNSVIYAPKKKPRILEKALILGAGVFLGTKL